MDWFDEGAYQIVRDEFPKLFAAIAALVERGVPASSIAACAERVAGKYKPVSGIPGLVEGAARHMVYLKSADKRGDRQ